MSNILNLKTGEPFDPLPRLHHRPESSLAVSSSEHSSRARGMLLGAKSFYIGGAKWRNPYVTDGLIAMWDGEWNAGGGVHDANATVWKDIVGDIDLTYQDGILVKDQFASNDTHDRGGSSHAYISSYCIAGSSSSVSSTIVQSEFVAMDWRHSSSSSTGSFTVWINGGSAVSAVGTQSSVTMQSTRYLIGYGTNGAVTRDTAYLYGRVASLSCDAAGKRIVTDGATVTGGTAWGSQYADATGFTIGGRQSGQWQEMIGRVYCVRLYSRQLTSAEVAENHAVDKARFGIA